MSDALLRALDITIKRRIDGLIQGDFRAYTVGPGTELAQVRLYSPGDDVRRIDWNVTARTGDVHVRVHVPERSLTSWILLDASASMHFGTADRRKADVAEGVVLAATHLGTRGGNRVGVMTFGSGADRLLPPSMEGVPVIQLLSALHGGSPPEHTGATSVGRAIERTARGLRSGGVVFVVSDWRGASGWTQPLRMLVQRHHVIAVEIRDEREMTLADIGDTYFVDFETGRQVRVDTGDPKLRQRFEEAARIERAAVGRAILGSGAEHCVLTTSGDWLRPFAAFLSKGRLRR
jgi:uncharacterized protein (DUF58 family)